MSRNPHQQNDTKYLGLSEGTETENNSRLQEIA